MRTEGRDRGGEMIKVGMFSRVTRRRVIHVSRWWEVQLPVSFTGADLLTLCLLEFKLRLVSSTHPSTWVWGFISRRKQHKAPQIPAWHPWWYFIHLCGRFALTWRLIGPQHNRSQTFRLYHLVNGYKCRQPQGLIQPLVESKPSIVYVFHIWNTHTQLSYAAARNLF